jgi:hypothetical protein
MEMSTHRATVESITLGIGGRDLSVSCVRVDQVSIVLARGFLRKAWVYDDWYSDVHDPDTVLDVLSGVSPRPDIFTFVQRFPDTEPHFPYYWEHEKWAVLPITTFDHWWNNQLRFKARNHARKAAKKGVVLRRAEFDEEFINGMVEIFNETPIRQGRPFWHYGKDFETVKREFSRFLFRETLIGAYFKDELIGFVMLGDAGHYAVMGQIISKIRHRDKSTNNALLAEAVRVCEEKSIPSLVYASWDERTLGAFKKSNGFEPISVPRYFIPITAKGRAAISLNLHHGLRSLIPENLQNRARELRHRYHRVRHKSA